MSDREEYSYVLDELGCYSYKKVKKKTRLPAWAAGVLAAAVTCCVCFAAYTALVLPHMRSRAAISPSAPAAVGQSEEAGGFAGLGERLDGSICTVSAQSVSGGGFFGRMVSQQSSTGTVISADGYILTASSAVDQNGTTVRLSDGQDYPAEVVGIDTKTDCAILKIDKDGLTPVEFADSSTLASGARVAAIGRYLNAQLGTTMTLGTICGVNNGVELSGGQTINLLQTDAAPADCAGCMLFDENGRAVGMITTMISSGASGISLAVPSNDIAQVTESITGTGTSASGLVIGIRGSDTAHGVQVEAVAENSPASEGDVKKGDLILKADEQTVASVADLNKIRDTHQKGDRMILTVYRDGEMLEIEIVL